MTDLSKKIGEDHPQPCLHILQGKILSRRSTPRSELGKPVGGETEHTEHSFHGGVDDNREVVASNLAGQLLGSCLRLLAAALSAHVAGD